MKVVPSTIDTQPISYRSYAIDDGSHTFHPHLNGLAHLSMPRGTLPIQPLTLYGTIESHETTSATLEIAFSVGLEALQIFRYKQRNEG